MRVRERIVKIGQRQRIYDKKRDSLLSSSSLSSSIDTINMVHVHSASGTPYKVKCLMSWYWHVLLLTCVCWYLERIFRKFQAISCSSQRWHESIVWRPSENHQRHHAVFRRHGSYYCCGNQDSARTCWTVWWYDDISRNIIAPMIYWTIHDWQVRMCYGSGTVAHTDSQWCHTH